MTAERKSNTSIPPERRHFEYLVYGILSFLFFAIAIISFAWWSNHRRMDDVMREIDNRSLVVAEGLKLMLAPDFHDRAVDEKAISFEEEMKNRRAFNEFRLKTGFKWIYTLVEKDGKYYFTAPSVSEEEAKERKSWYFYPYDDIPEEFVEALRTSKKAYVSYSDQWGAFRSIALPETSPGGRKYLSCADFEITHLEALKRRNFMESVAIALFFFACSSPIMLVAWRYFRTSAKQLRKMNEELTVHKTHLEELVEARTRELKTLSGLLPICSSCKKIRDDKGYWNQLESYIRARSDAEFSHGLCPDCARRLYPDIMEGWDGAEDGDPEK